MVDQPSLFSDLRLLFNPRSIALVGASSRADSVGGRTLENLLDVSHLRGPLYLINPTKSEIRGLPCHISVRDLPEAPDVAIITVPAKSAIAALEDCAEKGAKFAIVLTSGFGETGQAGKRVEEQMRAIAQRSGMRIYGPNCPGLNNINARIGMSFSPAFRLDLTPGPIGLATQGGGLGRTVMQSMERGIGVAAWASSGNQADLEVSDFIHYMADAPDVKVIITVIEGFKSGEKFVAAVQHAAAQGKPVVALKVGKSEYGVRAAQSHTASITGSAQINSVVLKQLGVIEVDDMDELVDTAWLLARQLPTGKEKLVIYGPSGGAVTLAADKVGSAGLTLAEFEARTTERLKAVLPDYAAIGNPVDVGTEIFTNSRLVDDTLEAIVQDPEVGLVLYTFPLDYGQVMRDNAESAVRVQSGTDVPILPVWMSDRLGDGYHALVKAGLVPSRSLNNAVRAIGHWIEWGRWLKQRDPGFMPQPVSEPRSGTHPAPTRSLTEAQGKRLLSEAGISFMEHAVASNVDEAVRLADAMGYPLVAKIVSPQITHKSEVGGVAVGLANAQAVRAACEGILKSVKEKAPHASINGLLIERMAGVGGMEVFIGVQRDEVFGPIISFGLGGIYVEVFKDISRRMLPLTPSTCEAMVREVQCFPLLDGARGKPRCDLKALQSLLLKVSEFVVAHPEVQEIDLNPVWVGPQRQGAIPLDAVVIVEESFKNTSE
ncbi:acetate--CoA ligase family protein [Alicycliphilus denitrificans]|uniref:acetate--CoA ligase family protein n=1 Tax=Alicycliphilus denitrificans TaxID=179636 RepID=UPI0019165593|nr:acetate--CoA ligase family protein [Alicycliphilus denitrificans]MBN9576619.1 acetate--CoA ligase family protein [Alicycliphilus denitrificans]